MPSHVVKGTAIRHIEGAGLPRTLLIERGCSPTVFSNSLIWGRETEASDKEVR